MLRLTIILFLALPTTLWGQIKTEKFFFDDDWKACDSVSAKYVSEYLYNDTKSKSGTIKTNLVTGQLKSVCQYSDIKLKKLEGVSKHYYDNGVLKSEINFVAGKPNGEITTFYSNGQIRRKDHFENYKFVSGNCYTIDGKDTTHFDYMIMPQFPGGDEARMNFLSENTYYPGKARRNNISGTVVVEFVVNQYGIIAKVGIVKSVDQLLDKEAIRVVEQMPRWEPGRIEGEKVSILYYMPINFKLQ